MAAGLGGEGAGDTAPECWRQAARVEDIMCRCVYTRSNNRCPKGGAGVGVGVRLLVLMTPSNLKLNFHLNQNRHSHKLVVPRPHSSGAA